MEKTLSFIDNFGFSSFSLMDSDGLPILESAKGIDPAVYNVSELFFKFFESRVNSSYISWSSANNRFVALLVEKKYLFIGQLSEKEPMTKILYNIESLKSACSGYLRAQ